MSNQKQVIVVNQFNSDNLGDKLLNKLLCDNLVNENYKVINTGFAQTSPQSVLYCEHRKSIQIFKNVIKRICPEYLKFMFKYKKRLDYEMKKLEVKDCSAIVIGGGQLLKSKSVFFNCLKYWSDWAKKNDLFLCLYGIGVDKNLNTIEKKKYKAILRKVDYINCRDLESKKILENDLNVSSVNISPDIAFTLKSNKQVNKDNIILVMPYNYKTAVTAFGLRISRSDYFIDIKNKILANKKENQKIFLTATTSNDAFECYRFQEYLNKNKIKCRVLEVYNYNELIKVIEKSDCIITGRMHAMIIGVVCGVNVIPLIVSDKINQFYEEYIKREQNIEKIRMLSRKGITELSESIERYIS